MCSLLIDVLLFCWFFIYLCFCDVILNAVHVSFISLQYLLGVGLYSNSNTQVLIGVGGPINDLHYLDYKPIPAFTVHGCLYLGGPNVKVIWYDYSRVKKEVMFSSTLYLTMIHQDQSLRQRMISFRNRKLAFADIPFSN